MPLRSQSKNRGPVLPVNTSIVYWQCFNKFNEDHCHLRAKGERDSHSGQYEDIIPTADKERPRISHRVQASIDRGEKWGMQKLSISSM